VTFADDYDHVMAHGLAREFELPCGIRMLPLNIRLVHLSAQYQDGVVADQVSIGAAVTVLERTTRATVQVQASQLFDAEVYRNDPRAIVKRVLMSILEHEVDELLLHNGEYQDPHRGR